MKRETISALAAINRAFYTETAQAFDATRDAPWAGWERLLAFLPNPETHRSDSPALPAHSETLRVLDIGCGNGRFARFLADRSKIPFHYVGLDTSQPLLEAAQPIIPPPGCRFEWTAWDFLDNAFPTAVAAHVFNLIGFFGVMHHVPSFSLRQGLLRRASGLLAPGGILALAFWRFGDEPRFKRRILPWETLTELRLPDVPTFDPDELEPGDHLLAWGEEQGKLRYCHAVDAEEEQRLLSELPLEPVVDYFADGREQRLNHYQLFRRPENEQVPEATPNA